jgi:hypothetical protein
MFRTTSLFLWNPKNVDVARKRARVKKADAFMDELLLKRLTKVNKTNVYMH